MSQGCDLCSRSGGPKVRPRRGFFRCLNADAFFCRGCRGCRCRCRRIRGLRCVEAARGLHGRRRAGRCLPAKHTRACPTRTCAILASFKSSPGNERLCGDFDGVCRCLYGCTDWPRREATTAAATAAAPSADERVSMAKFEPPPHRQDFGTS
jgi:hypothetical protein